MNFFTYLSDLMFPPKCIYCSEVLKPATRPLICERCMDEVPAIQTPCAKCGGALLYRDARPFCPTCHAAGRHFDGVVCSARYDGKMREAVLKYKYSYQSYLAKPLSYFLIKDLKEIGISRSNMDCVVSVPCDMVRESQRGFDHAGLLGKEISAALRIPYVKNKVEKIKPTKSQTKLSSAKRAENIRGAYKISDKDFFKGKAVLLADDIFTTGATAMELSRILKRAGAAYVFVAAVAKTVRKF